MSTHNIGSVRLLFLALVFMLVGAGVFSYVSGHAAIGRNVLVVRGGTIEIEPWNGELLPQGSDWRWEHAVSNVHLAIAKAESDDQEFVQMDPVALQGVKSVRIGVRVNNTRTIEGLVTLTVEDTGLKISTKEGQLARKGDVWVHSGFAQGGRQLRYEISTIELLDRAGSLVMRYQNPDLGRRLRFRIKFSA